MKRVVVFLDSSVLLEILEVPGKCQCPEKVHSQLRDRTERGESLILPTASIIETGNHIAQLGDGVQRRTLAESLKKVLESAMGEDSPWVLNGARWDEGLLSSICGGARGCPPLPEMATQGIGTGDVSILAEAEAYATRVTHVDVSIWTLDGDLDAYS